jgi:hypothetical protein
MKSKEHEGDFFVLCSAPKKIQLKGPNISIMELIHIQDRQFHRKLILLRFLSAANRQNTSHETAGHNLLLKKPGLFDQNPHEEST